MRIGSALAAAAVVVALPRHLVAQLHQAGYPAPTGPVWPVVVIGSAIAWAALEAGTMFYLWHAYTVTRRRHLLALMFTILAAIAATNAPSLVADSAGLTLTGLVGVASIAHWLWSVASIAATLLVVVAAGAADAASMAVNQRIDALVDAIDARQTPAQAVQPVPITVQPVAAQQVTVNVSRESDAPKVRGRESATERAVAFALSAGATSSSEIAAKIGVSSPAVRMTSAWRHRPRIAQNAPQTHPDAQGGAGVPA